MALALKEFSKNEVYYFNSKCLHKLHIYIIDKLGIQPPMSKSVIQSQTQVAMPPIMTW